MAGAGQRFADRGYTTPKPLIPINGVPMVVRAANSLPRADKWLFLVRADNIEGSGIDQVLTSKFSPCEIVPVESLTEGQACTCLLARDHLKPDDWLNIGACDNAMIWNQAKFDAVRSDHKVDGIIWTFRRNPAVLQDPRMYGWVKTNDQEQALSVSVKIPISDDPMNDHAVIGAFSFRKAADFLRCADDMIAQDRRIKNEFYVDELMNVAIESGLRIQVFEVDYYVCWGTPQDLDTYNYWAGYFDNGNG
jgi:NDP-sugar pyrophosphorylase family protein